MMAEKVPSSKRLRRWLQIAEEVARHAGDSALAIRAAGLSATLKTPGDTVSDADIRVENQIVSALRRHTPDAGFVCEESQAMNPAGDLVWVVDAIDGSTNFVRGLPDWCVSIAMLSQGQPVIGVVFAPTYGWTAAAAKGLGITVDGHTLEARPPWSGAPVVALGFAPFASGLEHAALTRSAAEHGIAYRRSGSGALALALVARGRLDAFVQPAIEPWDALAGAVLVTDSGGSLLGRTSRPGLQRETMIAVAHNAAPPVLEWVRSLFNRS